jgi:hypothetical protein
MAFAGAVWTKPRARRDFTERLREAFEVPSCTALQLVTEQHWVIVSGVCVAALRARGVFVVMVITVVKKLVVTPKSLLHPLFAGPSFPLPLPPAVHTGAITTLVVIIAIFNTIFDTVVITVVYSVTQ